MISSSCRKVERISKASLGKAVSVISRNDAAAGGGGLRQTYETAPVRISKLRRGPFLVRRAYPPSNARVTLRGSDRIRRQSAKGS